MPETTKRPVKGIYLAALVAGRLPNPSPQTSTKHRNKHDYHTTTTLLQP